MTKKIANSTTEFPSTFAQSVRPPSLKLPLCPWCDRQVMPHPKGLPKIYCCSEHKQALRTALFEWADDEFKRGAVTVANLRMRAEQRAKKTSMQAGS